MQIRELQIVIALVVQEEKYSDVLSNEEKRDPFLFEKIQDMINFFSPSVEEKFLEKFKSEFELMSYADANAIVQAFESNPPKNELADPELVRIARKILVPMIYFEKTAKGQQHCEKVQNLKLAIERALNKIENLKKKLSRFSEESDRKELIEVQIQALEEFVANKKRELDSSQQYTLVNHFNAKKYAKISDCKNPEMQRAAENSNKIFTDYVQPIEFFLKNSGADMSRKDLLKSLIKPPFLFDHYGIVVAHVVSNKEFPFTHQRITHQRIDQSLGYKLANKGPFELECEIIEDLRRYFKTAEFPPRAYPIPVDPDCLGIRDEMMQIINTWATNGNEEDVKKLKNFLIHRGGWSQHNILAHQMTISVPENTQSLFQLTGRLTYLNNTVDFTFNTSDFIPLLVHRSVSDSKSSLQFLEDFKEKALESQMYYHPAPRYHVPAPTPSQPQPPMPPSAGQYPAYPRNRGPQPCFPFPAGAK